MPHPESGLDGDAASGHGAGDARAIVPGGAAPPAAIPAEIFTAAVDAFAAGQRLDMRPPAQHPRVAPPPPPPPAGASAGRGGTLPRGGGRQLGAPPAPLGAGPPPLSRRAPSPA